MRTPAFAETLNDGSVGGVEKEKPGSLNFLDFRPFFGKISQEPGLAYIHDQGDALQNLRLPPPEVDKRGDELGRQIVDTEKAQVLEKPAGDRLSRSGEARDDQETAGSMGHGLPVLPAANARFRRRSI